MEQLAGAGPLVAVGGLPGRPRRSRDPRPVEHLPDGRVRDTGRASNKPRPPTRLPAAGADRLGELGRELAGRAVRTTRAIEKAGQRAPRLLARLQPTMPPAVRRPGEALKAASADFSDNTLSNPRTPARRPAT